MAQSNLDIKYLILGAGPSGLSFAHTLKSLGEESFIIIEKEPIAGGLCRSEEVDGGPVDIGGGHFLDMKRKEVLDILFQFMPLSEWQEHARVSKIKIRGREIDYPLEANLWQLPVADQIDFLESIAEAGCIRGLPVPESFEGWISWKLGDLIAKEYMVPYNRKIWSINLNELNISWLHKLPRVSFRETLQSCLTGRAFGSIPAHKTFLYPKHYGYGEVWRRMGEALGNRLVTSTPVTSIDIANRIVNSKYKAEKIISTIPWTEWPKIADVPESINAQIFKLWYVSIDIDYHTETLSNNAHWVYDPDESVPYHRILLRNNFGRGRRGQWTETNVKRSTVTRGWRYRNKYAYPLNTKKKPNAITEILSWANDNNIVGLGRWGTWEHINSDIAVSLGIAKAKQIKAEE